jgi:hypothetical protein
LVVIRGKDDTATPELALMAGLALGYGLRVIWIGPPVNGIECFPGVLPIQYSRGLPEEDSSEEILPIGFNLKKEWLRNQNEPQK